MLPLLLFRRLGQNSGWVGCGFVKEHLAEQHLRLSLDFLVCDQGGNLGDKAQDLGENIQGNGHLGNRNIVCRRENLPLDFTLGVPAGDNHCGGSDVLIPFLRGLIGGAARLRKFRLVFFLFRIVDIVAIVSEKAL